MSNDLIDRTRAVRDGEELDLRALGAHLEAALAPELRAELGLQGSISIAVEQFPSGYSNLTYLLRVGAQEMVLRRPPFAVQVQSGHDMAREYRVLSALQGHYPPAPRPYLYCEDGGVIGAPFYVMERRRGVILRRSLPRGLELGPPTLRALCESLVDELARLHAVDFEAAGLGDLGRPEGYVQRQVEGWRRRWEKAKTEDVPDMDALGEWLEAHRPEPAAAALIHNDFKFDNVILDPEELRRVIGVLDWEMATLGDPLMDLGTSLAYWVQADDDPRLQFIAFGPTWRPGALTRAEVVARYAERTGHAVEGIHWYYCFGVFKNAVIGQQIYWRFKHGHTSDRRFEGLNLLVALMGEVGLAAANAGTL